MEKGFYCLLKKHKAKRLENYNQEDDTEKSGVGKLKVVSNALNRVQLTIGEFKGAPNPRVELQL